MFVRRVFIRYFFLDSIFYFLTEITVANKMLLGCFLALFEMFVLFRIFNILCFLINFKYFRKKKFDEIIHDKINPDVTRQFIFFIDQNQDGHHHMTTSYWEKLIRTDK